MRRSPRDDALPFAQQTQARQSSSKMHPAFCHTETGKAPPGLSSPISPSRLTHEFGNICRWGGRRFPHSEKFCLYLAEFPQDLQCSFSLLFVDQAHGKTDMN